MMLTNVVDRLRRRRQLLLRTQAAHDERQRQYDDHQTRDPQQSDGSLLSELIAQSVAEICEVQRNHDR